MDNAFNVVIDSIHVITMNLIFKQKKYKKKSSDTIFIL